MEDVDEAVDAQKGVPGGAREKEEAERTFVGFERAEKDAQPGLNAAVEFRIRKGMIQRGVAFVDQEDERIPDARLKPKVELVFRVREAFGIVCVADCGALRLNVVPELRFEFGGRAEGRRAL